MPKNRPQETRFVRIREHGGHPVRSLLKFATGDLVPGEVLEVPKFQADMAEEQGTVDVVESPAATAKPKGKKAKPKSKVSAPDPAPVDPSPDFTC